MIDFGDSLLIQWAMNANAITAALAISLCRRRWIVPDLTPMRPAAAIRKAGPGQRRNV